MRIRTIKPEFWTDPTMVRLSLLARLLYVALWNYADDSGRFEWEYDRIQMTLFPRLESTHSLSPHGVLSEDSVSPHAPLMQAFLDLTDARCIVWSKAEVTAYGESKRGIVIGAMPGFTRHQKINRPSASKLPDCGDCEPLGGFPDSEQDSLSPHGGLSEGSVRAHRGKGREGKGSTTTALAASPRPKKTPTRKTRRKPDDEVTPGSRVVRHYEAEFRRLLGSDPPPIGAKERAAAKRALKSATEDELRRMVTVALEDRRRGFYHSLGNILSSQGFAELRPKVARGGGAPQFRPDPNHDPMFDGPLPSLRVVS